MKILILNYEFPPVGGGAGLITYELAKRFVKKGFQVDVVTMGLPDLLPYENIDGINVYRVPTLRRKKEIATTLDMFSFILPGLCKSKQLHKKNKYNICHCHFALPTGLVAYFLKKMTGLPYVLTLHGSDVPGYNPDRFKLLHKILLPFFRVICKGAKTITLGSKFLLDLLHKTIDVEAIVLPNGIDTKEYLPLKKEKYILIGGRIHQQKGLQHVIEAVSQKKNWPVYVAGDGPYKEELEKLAVTSKTKIHFLGWQSKEQMKKLVGKAGIFILSSQKENSSLAILEAMSSGCAIITTKSTGSKELVGRAGELVSYGSSEEIIQKIELIKKNIISYQERSLKRAAQFDVDRITKKYISLLQ